MPLSNEELHVASLVTVGLFQAIPNRIQVRNHREVYILGPTLLKPVNCILTRCNVGEPL